MSVRMSDPHPSVAALLGRGELAAAVAAASAAVKAKPLAAADRILLAELLALQGENERADTHLKLAADQAPAELIAISQLRWLLRAAEARRAWYEAGSVPDFVGEPTTRQQLALRLALAVKAGDAAEAASLRETLEAEPLPEAAVDDAAPAPLRDACDLSQQGFEVLSLDGRYLWLAPEQVAAIRFARTGRPRDRIWRQAEVTLRDGRQVTFLVVAQYFDPEATDAQRTGGETDWVETVEGVVRGRGQRMLLVGDDLCGINDIGRIRFAEPA